MADTLINGNRWSHPNLRITAGGRDLPAGCIKAITYDAAQDPGIVQGNRTTIMGRTVGYGLGTGSIEILTAEINDFFAALTNNGTFPIMGIDFDIIVTYSINDIDTTVDELRGVRITKVGASSQQGNDANTRSCDLNIARMLQNGIELFADVE